jgi:hypothetical protein
MRVMVAGLYSSGMLGKHAVDGPQTRRPRKRRSSQNKRDRNRGTGTWNVVCPEATFPCSPVVTFRPQTPVV